MPALIKRHLSMYIYMQYYVFWGFLQILSCMHHVPLAWSNSMCHLLATGIFSYIITVQLSYLGNFTLTQYFYLIPNSYANFVTCLHFSLHIFFLPFLGEGPIQPHELHLAVISFQSLFIWNRPRSVLHNVDIFLRSTGDYFIYLPFFWVCQIFLHA